jgi:hypothetical protein
LPNRRALSVIIVAVKKDKKPGRIIIPYGISIWQHELQAANALAGAGYIVEFMTTKNMKHTKSPDILMDGKTWEIKSPSASKLSAVERNLKRAYHQSSNIVFDSHRMGRLPDKSIQSELIKQFKLTKNIQRILFVNRKREVIDIQTLT